MIGVGGLRTQQNFTDAINTGFTEFVAAGVASMLNRDLGILLKENKGDKLLLELDPEHPEKYAFPTPLWNICLSDHGFDLFPPVKGKTSIKK